MFVNSLKPKTLLLFYEHTPLLRQMTSYIWALNK